MSGAGTYGDGYNDAGYIVDDALLPVVALLADAEDGVTTSGRMMLGPLVCHQLLSGRNRTLSDNTDTCLLCRISRVMCNV